MTLTDQVIQNIIKRLIKGQDYRIEVVSRINAEFFQFAISFFKKVVEAKLHYEHITIDWYKKVFLDPRLTSDEIAIHSGLNKKTITNMFNSATKEIVIDASNEHYDVLSQLITSLIEHESEVDLTLTIKLRGVSVELNISESLIVINTLAVKRAALRGGFWSSAGKRVEKYLMITLCRLYRVPSQYYDQSRIIASVREVDFYLHSNGKDYRCEVKLMGKGNPESADVISARDTDIFVADKLSDLNKQELERLGVPWVELRSDNGHKRFESVLQALNIPYVLPQEDGDTTLDVVLEELFTKQP